MESNFINAIKAEYQRLLEVLHGYAMADRLSHHEDLARTEAIGKVAAVRKVAAEYGVKL